MLYCFIEKESTLILVTVYKIPNTLKKQVRQQKRKFLPNEETLIRTRQTNNSQKHL